MAKYDDLLLILQDEEVYSAGLIVQLAQDIGYAKTREALLRIRLSLNNKCYRYEFPKTGDGWVRIAGQGPTPGWFGKRWKSLIKIEEEPPSV